MQFCAFLPVHAKPVQERQRGELGENFAISLHWIEVYSLMDWVNMEKCVCVCVCVCERDGEIKRDGWGRRAEGCVREGDPWKDFQYPVAGFHG